MNTLGDRLDQWSVRRIAVVMGLGLFVLYATTATYDLLQVTDTQSAMAAAWGLGTTGGVTLPASWLDLPWRSITVDGDVVSNRFPGATLWGALFYAVLPTATEVSRAHDVPVLPAAIAASVASAAAMAILFVVLDRILDDRRLALGGALVFALATGTWSVSADALWTHGPAQLVLALAMLALTRERWWWAGIAFGAAIVCRPQLGFVPFVVGIWLTLRHRSIRPALAIGLAALPGLVFLMFWSHELFGTWQPVAGYGTGKVGNVLDAVSSPGGTTGVRAITNFVPLLFHPLRGVLVYSLWIWPCLPGLRRGWRVADDWVRAIAVGGLLVMVVQLASNATWHGGDDHFAYRLPLEWLMLSMPLLMLSWREFAGQHRLGRVATALLAATSIIIFAAGSTIADPRELVRDEYFEIVSTFGPNGEGYDPGGAVGVDASR